MRHIDKLKMSALSRRYLKYLLCLLKSHIKLSDLCLEMQVVLINTKFSIALSVNDLCSH